MLKTNEQTQRYALLGMAAMLPGMEMAVEVLQQQIAEMRQALAEVQRTVEKPWRAERPDRELRTVEVPTSKRGGWPADPKERKAEMARRVNARVAKVRGRKISEAQKSAWAGMSVRQRKARLAAMAAGKAEQAKVKRLEAA